MRRQYNRTPYMMRARFSGQCQETGKPINKGDIIAYYPATKTAYHESSKAADNVRALEFSRACNMADSNF